MMIWRVARGKRVHSETVESERCQSVSGCQGVSQAPQRGVSGKVSVGAAVPVSGGVTEASLSCIMAVSRQRLAVFKYMQSCRAS